MKSILVIDTPKSCSECPCFCLYYCLPTKKELGIAMSQMGIPINFCPLKPMPQELPTPYMMRQIQIANGIQTEKPPYTEDYQKGYNDCINEILGEENE